MPKKLQKKEAKNEKKNKVKKSENNEIKNEKIEAFLNWTGKMTMSKK